MKDGVEWRGETFFSLKLATSAAGANRQITDWGAVEINIFIFQPSRQLGGVWPCGSLINLSLAQLINLRARIN